MLQVQLNGFFRPDFVTDRPVLVKFGEAADGALASNAARSTEIHDARRLQDSELSERQFFARHGFVLLHHESAVTNWEIDPAAPAADSDIARIYVPEVDVLIRRRLMPGVRLELWHSHLSYLRRGPGTANPFYGSGVHQDFGLTADDYQQAMEAFSTVEIGRLWRSRYDQDDVAGFTMIDFWRTTNMNEPLKHMPLAVCDPASVSIEDVVPIGLLDFTPTGKPTNQMSLRMNEGQKWYYYPDMASSEVLVLKVFEVFKDDRERKVRTCFHTAFADPAAPRHAEPRQSCEHRVGIFHLND
jgi:hypothetical protein